MNAAQDLYRISNMIEGERLWSWFSVFVNYNVKNGELNFAMTYVELIAVWQFFLTRRKR